MKVKHNLNKIVIITIFNIVTHNNFLKSLLELESLEDNQYFEILVNCIP
jgi:hypothetical protein